MITLDSSALVAIVNVEDMEHGAIVAALFGDPGPHIIPVSVLSETAYVLERRTRQRGVEVLLEDIALGNYTLDCGEQDAPRILELIRRYADFPLGFADAAIIACAERNGGRVLTLDRRHFGVVAREGTITVVPGPV